MKVFIVLGRVVRTLAAGAVLVAIEGGLPYLLTRFVGWPLPSRLPSLREVEGVLTSPLPDQMLLDALVVPLWLLWAAFSIALVVEVTALAQGIEIHVPLLGPLQALAAGLLGSMAIAVLPIDLRAASFPVRPVTVSAVLDQAPQRFHEVKPRESLWKIARHRLGSGHKWPKLWQLNKHRRQVDGRVFTDPDLIQPGWRLRLPALPRQRVPVVVPTPVVDQEKPDAQSPPVSTVIVTIDVPSGGALALSAVVGMCAAQAIARLHRRRRRVPPPAAEGVTIAPKPETPPVVEAARRAYRQVYDSAPVDADLIRSAAGIEVPGDVVVGVTEGGAPVRLALSGLRLGVTGPGGDDVVRAVLMDLLHQAGDFRVEILSSTADAARLMGREVGAVPGLTLLDSARAAVDRFEEVRFTRRRMLAERDAEHVEELRDRDPGEVLPAVLLVAAAGGDLLARLGDLVEERCGMGALVLGQWSAAATCRVRPDHRASAEQGLFPGAALVHTAAADLADALGQLAEPDIVEPDPSGPIRQAVDREYPTSVWVQVLGRPAVWVRGDEQPLRIRGLKLSLLLYLALHPRGATKEAICEALWPGKPTGHEFHSLLRHLRAALETATKMTGESFVLAMDNETYRIDDRRIGFDLWEFQRAVRDAKASASTGRAEVLARAAELCGGELGAGINEEWVLEERYSLTLAQVDVLTQLAELCQEGDPELALELLDQARGLDPDTEEIWCRIMRLHQRLDRHDRARRVGQLLVAHLRTLEVEPTEDTAELLAVVLRNAAPVRRPKSHVHQRPMQ